MKYLSIKKISDIYDFQGSLEANKACCFRGQADSSWELIPSIYRPLINATPAIEKGDGEWIGQCERDIYREFGCHSRALIDPHSYWEQLCVAQHYGCPTRLLDWTRNFLVAVYFSILRPADKSGMSAVWCLNLSDFQFPVGLGRQVPKGGHRIANLNHYSNSFRPSFLQEVSEPIDVITQRLGKDPPDAALVIFEAPSVVPRIENQYGLFSIYLSFDDYDLLLDQSKLIRELEQSHGLELLTKIEIPHSEADHLRSEIERSGIDRYRLFPDLVGLGLYMEDECRRLMKVYMEAR